MYKYVPIVCVTIAQQFLFDRSKQQNIASFITEPDIVEDNEDVEALTSLDDKCNLSELEKAKLVSCMETIKTVTGDSISESKLREQIITSDFNVEVALDAILKKSAKDIGILSFDKFIHFYAKWKIMTV